MTHRADPVRQAVVVILAVGQAVLPSVFTPAFVDEEIPPNVMEPAGYTFSAWVPIFAASIAHGQDQARRGRAADPALRSVGWPLAVSLASTAVWAPLVATRRYWSAQSSLVVLAVAAEATRRRVAEAARAIS